jgi:peptide/nickel transport system substrate-binding protein
MYEAASKILYDEQYAAPIYSPTLAYVMKDEVEGFVPATGSRSHWTPHPVSKTGVPAGQEVTVVYAQASDAAHGNGLFISTTFAAEGMGMAIYDTLVELDENLQPTVPRLAKSWTISEDGLTYTFNLRDDVYWHDGEKFTSEDVKFSIETRANPNVASVARHSEYSMVDYVETPDDYTAIVHMKDPYPRAMTSFSANAMIVPAHPFEGYEPENLIDHPFDQNPIGTGPYEFVEWKRDESITLVKNENYWGEQGNIDKIVIRVIPDATSALLALKAGEVDILSYQYGYTTELAELENDPNIKVEMYDTLKTTQIAFNNQHPQLANKYVRWAISHMIPRDHILENAVLGMGTRMDQYLLPHVTGHNPDLSKIEYDPVKAAEYMKKAGYDIELLKPVEAPKDTYNTWTIVGAVIGLVVGVAITAMFMRRS